MKSKGYSAINEASLIGAWVYDHCIKYHVNKYFTQFPDVDVLWKCTTSTEFRAKHPKLCGNCAFPKISTP